MFSFPSFPTATMPLAESCASGSSTPFFVAGSAKFNNPFFTSKSECGKPFVSVQGAIKNEDAKMTPGFRLQRISINMIC